MLRFCLKHMSWFISIFERSLERKWANQGGNHNPIFILGVPRSGTTYYYQQLTNQGKYLYPDNLVGMAFRNLYFGFWLSMLFYKNRPHNCFKSNYGETKGLHSPNEFGRFWYGWIQNHRDAIEEDDINEQSVIEIRKKLNAVMNRWNRPIVMKNTYFSVRIPLLLRAFPDAKFVVVERSQEAVVRSILKAREAYGVDDGEWWGVRPKGYDQWLNKSGEEQARFMHDSLMEIIDVQLKDHTNKVGVVYEKFVESPEEHLF